MRGTVSRQQNIPWQDVCVGEGWGSFPMVLELCAGVPPPSNIFSVQRGFFLQHTRQNDCPPKLFSSHSCSSLQVLFDLGSVLSIETLQFLVELHVALVDIAHILFLIKASSPAVLLPLLNPGDNGYMYLSSWTMRRRRRMKYLKVQTSNMKTELLLGTLYGIQI